MEDKESIEDLDSQLRMAEILNDTPVEIEVAGQKRMITSIKPGVAALIAEEAARIQKSEKGDMVDLMRRMAECSPSVARCITLAILNDKGRIYSDYASRKHSEEYERTYEQVMWESDSGEWIRVLLGVLRLLNIDFFFRITDAVKSFRQMVLAKRKTEGQ